MTQSVKDIIAQFDSENPRMGEIKKLAASIKKDHELAMELWGVGDDRTVRVSVLRKT